MRTEIYVSSFSALSRYGSSAETPDGAMKVFSDAFKQRKFAKVVFFMEFIFLKKYFICPLDIWWLCYGKDKSDKLPDDMDSDFRFEFLKESDFIIKCRDGTVPAIKMVLNVSTSSFLKKELKKQSTGMELMVDHSVDVVKPLITFIHSGCFEMPKEYDLDFAERFLKVLEFFDLEREQHNKIRTVIDRSLFLKFIKEPHDFELILKWVSLAYPRFSYVHFMLPVVIANKYYYKWLERFPENERNSDNPAIQNLLGSIVSTEFELQFFKDVEANFSSSVLVNTIMS